MISTVIIPCLATDQIASAEDLTYITEQRPPYSYEKDGVLQGISVDLVEGAWERMGVSLDRSAIQLLPWTEGYERALNMKIILSCFLLVDYRKGKNSSNGQDQLQQIDMCYWQKKIRTSAC